MASIYKTYNSMGLPMNINRSNPIPVDSTELWYSLEDAKTYAKTDARAYVGQTLKIVDETNKTVTSYVIGDTTGNLIQLGSGGGEVTVGSTIAGFTVGDNALYNKYSKTVGNAPLEYYMTSPNEINYVVYLKNNESEFAYVGTDGIGTMKFTSLNGADNSGYSTLNTYMSAGKLFSNNAEITGGTITGITGTLGNTITISTYGLSNNATPSSGDWCLAPLNSMVGYSGIEPGGESCSGESPIVLFAGNNNKSAAVEVYAKNNTDNLNFYVTQSGLVRASNILCKGGGGYIVIENTEDSSYRSALSEYGLTIKNSTQSTSYTNSSLKWKSNNTTVGEIYLNTSSNYMLLGGTSWCIAVKDSSSYFSDGSAGYIKGTVGSMKYVDIEKFFKYVYAKLNNITYAEQV